MPRDRLAETLKTFIENPQLDLDLTTPTTTARRAGNRGHRDHVSLVNVDNAPIRPNLKPVPGSPDQNALNGNTNRCLNSNSAIDILIAEIRRTNFHSSPTPTASPAKHRDLQGHHVVAILSKQ
jgi:hypothetical protein